MGVVEVSLVRKTEGIFRYMVDFLHMPHLLLGIINKKIINDEF